MSDYKPGDLDPTGKYRLGHDNVWHPTYEATMEQYVEKPKTPLWRSPYAIVAACVMGLLLIVGIGLASVEDATKADKPNSGSAWATSTPEPAPSAESEPYSGALPACIGLVDEAITLSAKGSGLLDEGLSNSASIVSGDAGLDWSITFGDLSFEFADLSEEIGDTCSGVPGGEEMADSMYLWGESYWALSEAMEYYYDGNISSAESKMDTATTLAGEASAKSEAAVEALD